MTPTTPYVSKHYRHADILIMSAVELENICGEPINRASDAKRLLKRLIEMPDSPKTIITTMGSLGAVYVHKSAPENCTQIIVPPIISPPDRTGAGECFIGALAYCLVQYKHIKFEDQVRLSCEVARESVVKYGVQDSYPDNREVVHIFKPYDKNVFKRVSSVVD